MPGLIGTVARTAVIAGTATSVSNRVSRRQGNRWAAQQQPQYEPEPQPAPAPQYQPAAASPPAPDMLAQLQQLGELKQSGVLTEAEFEAQKARILSGS